MRLAEAPYIACQGEGERQGEPSIFLRLYGCDLRCSWCDSSHTYEGKGKWEAVEGARRGLSSIPIEWEMEEVATRLEALRCKSLVVTGGEPLLQAKALKQLFETLGDSWHITIETNGMRRVVDLDDHVDLWSVSPKLLSSAMPHNRDAIVSYSESGNTVFKFVIKRMEDLGQMEIIMADVPLVGPIYLQPDNNADGQDAYCGNEEYLRRLRWLEDAVKADAWLSENCWVRPQVHILLHQRSLAT